MAGTLVIDGIDPQQSKWDNVSMDETHTYQLPSDVKTTWKKEIDVDEITEKIKEDLERKLTETNSKLNERITKLQNQSVKMQSNKMKYGPT